MRMHTGFKVVFAVSFSSFFNEKCPGVEVSTFCSECCLLYDGFPPRYMVQCSAVQCSAVQCSAGVGGRSGNRGSSQRDPVREGYTIETWG